MTKGGKFHISFFVMEKKFYPYEIRTLTRLGVLEQAEGLGSHETFLLKRQLSDLFWSKIDAEIQAIEENIVQNLTQKSKS